MVSAITAPAPQQRLRTAEIVSVSLPVMPEYRIAAFRMAAAARLRAGVTIPTLVREQQALMLALADPDFETAMAKAFVAEMQVQQPNPEYHVSLPAAQVQVHGILNNRIRDLHGFLGLLANPEFVKTIQAEAAQPAPAAKEYDLPPSKKEEVVRRLVQDADQAGAEPAVHVDASARGQRATHMALANIFRPKAGQLRAPLVDAMARHWPEATGAELEQLATTWLKARHDPAHSIADGLKETGELYMAAIARAEQKKTPVPQVQTPAQTTVKLEGIPPMAMGVN